MIEAKFKIKIFEKEKRLIFYEPKTTKIFLESQSALKAINKRTPVSFARSRAPQ